MDGFKPCERESPMTTRPLAGTRRLALVLASCMLPILAHADTAVKIDSPPGTTTHPWKLAYARRIANEGMESRGEGREELAKRLLREWRRKQNALKAGQHARPVVPDVSLPRDAEAAPLRRLPRRFGVTTFTPPSN